MGHFDLFRHYLVKDFAVSLLVNKVPQMIRLGQRTIWKTVILDTCIILK